MKLLLMKLLLGRKLAWQLLRIEWLLKNQWRWLRADKCRFPTGFS
jgi:hypothetical protein